MNRLRLWILGAALGSFAAGMNVGLAAPRLMAADVPPSADEDYVQSITADYGLSAAQERQLRMVMQKWREEELLVMRSIETSQLPPAIQAGLLRVRGQMAQRIRAVLDEGQRERYDLATAQDPATRQGR